MRWLVFVIFALAGLVLDVSLLDVLAPDELRQIRPSLCGVLAVFVALSAPRMTALWACFILGMLLDLSHPLTMPEPLLDASYPVASPVVRRLHVIGPYALGYVAGGCLVLQVRTMVFRRRPLAIGVMTVGFLLAVHVVVVGLYVVRSWYPGGPVFWTELATLNELLRRFLIALYSGLFAIPIGWLLVKSMPLWGFQTVSHRSGLGRSY
ncbi:MAG: hypothetical protein ACYS0G_05465 [Planctomycetota bacterium]